MTEQDNNLALERLMDQYKTRAQNNKQNAKDDVEQNNISYDVNQRFIYRYIFEQMRGKRR